MAGAGKKDKKIAESRQAQQQIKAEKEKKASIVRTNTLLACIVALVGLVLYANTLNHGFVLDDYSVILENNVTKQGVKAIPEIFTSSYRSGYTLSTDELYRPLPKSIFALSWQLFGDNPMPLHLLNILLYALTGFLLFRFCMLLFNNQLFAFVTSLLFIAHPIHTEVVANIKSMDEILSFLFCIIAAQQLLRYFSNGNITTLLSGALSFLIAFFSKESSITFLAVFPLLIISFKPENSGQAKKPSSGLSIALFLGVTLFFLLVRYSILSKIPHGDPSVADNLLMAAKSFDQRFATAVLILGMYLKLIFFPHPLIFDYSYNQIPLTDLSDFRFIISFLIYAAMLIYAIWAFRKNKLIAFGILFYLISMSLYSNIFYIIGSSFGERFLYTAVFGICIVAGYVSTMLVSSSWSVSLKEFMSKNSKVLLPLLIIILLFSIKTIARNTVWKSNYSLYSNDVLLAPNSTRTHYYLGNYLSKSENTKGKSPKEIDSLQLLALSELKKSVAIYPFGDAYNQMGIIYDKRKDYKNSLESYQKAIEANPSDAVVYNNLGSLYFNSGKVKEAQDVYQKAIKYNPNYPEAYMNLGSTYGMLQQYDTALNYFFKAIKLNPNLAQAYYYIGLTYRFKGDENNAQSYLAKASQLDPEKFGSAK